MSEQSFAQDYDLRLEVNTADDVLIMRLMHRTQTAWVRSNVWISPESADTEGPNWPSPYTFVARIGPMQKYLAQLVVLNLIGPVHKYLEEPNWSFWYQFSVRIRPSGLKRHDVPPIDIALRQGKQKAQLVVLSTITKQIGCRYSELHRDDWFRKLVQSDNHISGHHHLIWRSLASITVICGTKRVLLLPGSRFHPPDYWMHLLVQ
ncbi:uncharacterized protein F5891DRAFT_979169 [Suillus fuscotomentosus]|uniref:Uncharacterized protein n=1 Tax=Suillus fuscotomentosus TaxID=1912939 RepID=A0AAD4E947_9AGAM|nr:uncharacterized protein F5891DRAFT_979169 [Suillus fuscotomentosus]KAG1901652.1 hypothetical protein F5891DRAFT_979169 [Suillus fuscotomentosus]